MCRGIDAPALCIVLYADDDGNLVSLFDPRHTVNWTF